MGTGTGVLLEDADELTLEGAYVEADLDWLELPLGFDFDPEDDGGFYERTRAVVEDASPYGLLTRLQAGQPVALGEALDMLRAADRLGSWVAARQASLIAEIFAMIDRQEDHNAGKSGGRSGGGSGSRLGVTLAAEEIAPLLRVPGRTAHRMLDEAVRLTTDLPATMEALEAGRISPAQAQVIVQESGSLPDTAVPGFEEQILTVAGGLTGPKLTRRCRRVREELHPETSTVRRVRAVEERSVSVHPEQDGMAWLGAYLPAEQAHGIFNRVDAAARSLQGPQERRTLSQLRADVFVDVLTHTCTGNPKNGTGFRGIGATVFVNVPVMTLLGHPKTPNPTPIQTPGTGKNPRSTDASGMGAGNDGNAGNAGTDGSPNGISGDSDVPGDPGEPDIADIPGVEGCENGLLDGYGPIDPDTARRLAAHAPSFTRILVHPETGAVLSVGRDRYRPPKHLQDWVRITHPTCIHPGCNRSSMSCEIDHHTPWARGGTTALNNLHPRCKLHHKLKTEGLWTTTPNDHHTPHITSLGGRTYTTIPEPPPPF